MRDGEYTGEIRDVKDSLQIRVIGAVMYDNNFSRPGALKRHEEHYRGTYGSRATSSWMRFSTYVSFAGPTTPSVGDHCTPWVAQRHFYDFGAGRGFIRSLFIYRSDLISDHPRSEKIKRRTIKRMSSLSRGTTVRHASGPPQYMR